MLHILWDIRGYFFWLLVISLGCALAERVRPWRREQRALRRGLGQDVVWLFLNGHFAGLVIARLGDLVIRRLAELGWPASYPGLLASLPPWLQFIILLPAKDICEWCVHCLLHRVPWLWEFHKVHHSIEELDWIGNFRFHWMETVIYKSLTYLPLYLLGASGEVVLWVAIFSTLIGHLNHANLRIDWGPLVYVLNSARMHVWHHDRVLHGRYGQNYAVLFSAWDWLFGTAYLPKDVEQPARLGFDGDERFPRGLLSRLGYPLTR